MRVITIATAAIGVVIVIQSDPLCRAAEPVKRDPSADQTAPRQEPADSAATHVRDQEIDKRAKQVLDESAKNLLAIKSIEFRAESDLSFVATSDGKLVKDARHRASMSYLFRCDGNRWRVDECVGDATEAESRSFNGERFQFFSPKLSAFRASKHHMGTRPQCPFPSPIARAYSWLFPPNGFFSLDELCDAASWSAAVKRAKYIGETKSNNKSVVTVEIQRVSSGGKAFLYSVNFDKAHSYTPLGWSSYSLPDRKPSTSLTVKRSVDVDAGMGRKITLPVETELGHTDRIVEGSLRVNQPIDESVFTLDRSLAKSDLGPYGLDEKTADFFKPRGVFSKRLADTQDEAEENHQRVLIILGDPDGETSQRFFELREKDWDQPLYEYRQLPIGKTDGPAVEAFRKTYPRLSDLDCPAFVVIDHDGKALGSLNLILSTASVASETAKGREFLERYAFEKSDAERLLADALARAKREDKKVFLQETGIYCAPCLLLSRFIEQHAVALGRSFVYLKIDPGRTQHGQEVIKRLRTDGSEGIPWSAILDAEGKVVATRLGFRSPKSKEVDDFVNFLSSNAPRLTAEELAQMRKDLDRDIE